MIRVVAVDLIDCDDERQVVGRDGDAVEGQCAMVGNRRDADRRQAVIVDVFEDAGEGHEVGIEDLKRPIVLAPVVHIAVGGGRRVVRTDDVDRDGGGVGQAADCPSPDR